MDHRVLDTIKACLTGDYTPTEVKRFLYELALSLAKVDTQQSKAGRYILHGTTGYYADARPFEMYFLDGKLTGSKIAAIKYIRTVTGMGLREAKDYVEALPVVVETRSIDL